MVGSGHSFTDIALTDGVMLDPSRLTGVTAVDRDAMTVTVLAGTPLHELNSRLHGLGLALHNMGDIDRQTVAGAVSTGTHGTGGIVASLSGQLEAVELVTGAGELVAADRERDPDLFQAARVGLGAVGVLTSLTFRVEPPFTLQALEEPMGLDEVLARHDELVAEHHHVDLYWFPHTDRCMVNMYDRTVDDPEPLGRVRAFVDDELLSNTLFGLLDRATTRFPGLTRRANQLSSRGLSRRTYSDSSERVFIASRRVRFREMEYSLPREQGMPALREVSRLIEQAGWQVAFPVEVRATPPDEAWLSTTYDRHSVYLAFHVGADVDHRAYFTGVERVLRAHGGRPHWGKLHTRTAADLAPDYARWSDFLAVRDRVDPDRAFGNGYLDRVLG
jgi:L-gulonolactone oxidase